MTRSRAEAEVDRDTPSLRSDASRNRERLLEAAAEVFAKRGLEASVNEVASVAGLGMGTLYRRFPTKEALIDELVRELLGRVLADGRAALSEPDGRGLETFLYAVGTQQSARLGCLPRLWNTAHHAELQARIRTVTTELLADAQGHRRVRSDLVPTDVFAVMWSLRGVIETTRATAPDAWRRHLEITLLGLRPGAEPLKRPPLPESVVERLVANLPV
jgi:AcrR family transcriptional regulator